MRRSGGNLIYYIRPDGSKLVSPLFPPHSENSLKATLILEKEEKPVFSQENSTLFKVGFFGCQNSAARRKYVVALLIGRLFLFSSSFPLRKRKEIFHYFGLASKCYPRSLLHIIIWRTQENRKIIYDLFFLRSDKKWGDPTFWACLAWVAAAASSVK